MRVLAALANVPLIAGVMTIGTCQGSGLPLSTASEQPEAGLVNSEPAAVTSPRPGEPTACGAITLSASFQRTPAAAGQAYVRCDTLGPENTWQQVALSPDGRRVAARAGDGTMRLIATDTWAEVGHIASSLGAIDAVAFSPDSTVVALLSSEMGQVTLVNSANGTQTRSIAGPPASTIDAYTASLAFSSDGRRLATSLGTLIDLTTFSATDWKTGMPVTSQLTINPENLGTGEANANLAFSAGDARLFVERRYQIGNSPTSIELGLRTPSTGQETVLFNMYDRALTGYALSPDGRFVALATTGEAQVGGFAAGLTVYRFDTGAQRATKSDFVGTVLGFSHDGRRLFTQVDATLTVLATENLRVVAQWAWPTGFTFVGVSPQDELVAHNASSTTWFSSSTGTPARALSRPLDHVTWSRNGALGAGTGDSTVLFDLWRESTAAELCAPPVRGTPAPALASLGTTLDGNGMATSTDGAIVVTDEPALHTHSANWNSLHVRVATDDSVARVFGAQPQAGQLAVSNPAGDKLYTPAGADIAVWCH